jgi:hypothetical protein
VILLAAVGGDGATQEAVELNLAPRAMNWSGLVESGQHPAPAVVRRISTSRRRSPLENLWVGLSDSEPDMFTPEAQTNRPSILAGLTRQITSMRGTTRAGSGPGQQVRPPGAQPK